MENNNIDNNMSAFQNVSPEMINMGFSAGQEMLNKQKERWLPGLSNFWLSLKLYFSVNNEYVSEKIKLLLYPFPHNAWSRVLADDVSMNSIDQDASRKYALPRNDVNAPDLYLPLMAYVTYGIIVCYSKDTDAVVFTPESLIQILWRCCLFQLCEVGLIKAACSLMSVTNIAILDMFSYTGYKYVGLCVSALVGVTIARLVGWWLYALVALYTSVACGYVILKSFAACVPKDSEVAATNGPPRHLVILGVAAIELVVALIFNWL